MHLVYNATLLLAAVKWGDWKGWRSYYPTILFFIMGDLLKNFLFHDYLLWTYQETIFAENLFSNHTFISLMIMYISYPATILIYLGRFPKERWKQLVWIVFWIFIYVTIEYINLEYLHLIKHHNGWSMPWSILFNIVMFPMLLLHHKKPLVTWGLSVLWILFLFTMFPLPLDMIK
ncbi:CBO0543 family protein [Ferdinandcohnia sp. Marseille-Q9671]